MEGIYLKDLISLIRDNPKIVNVRSEYESPFKLKSGKESRLFFDLKEAICNPKILGVVIEELIWEFHDLLTIHDKIAGLAIGSVPISTMISAEMYKPMIIIRNQQHNRGLENKIIGDVTGHRILIVDDVSTSGISIIDAAESIRFNQGICNNAIVVLDREEGAVENCLNHGIKLYSLLQKSDFGDFDDN